MNNINIIINFAKFRTAIFSSQNDKTIDKICALAILGKVIMIQQHINNDVNAGL